MMKSPADPEVRAADPALTQLLERLSQFFEETYGTRGLQDAWLEFHRWRPPASVPSPAQAEFFRAWLLWDWTPDANDPHLDPTIPRELTCAEFFAQTHSQPLPAEERAWLTTSLGNRFSFFEAVKSAKNGSDLWRNLLTDEELSPSDSDSLRPDHRGDLVLALPAAVIDRTFLSWAPHRISAAKRDAILTFKAAITSELGRKPAAADLRAYAFEILDLYLSLHEG